MSDGRREGEEGVPSRAFVLGLDGVPWYLVERWTDAGELPNFQRLVDEGASGALESSKPANTPVAWPSIATGTSPDSHGLYEFYKLRSNHSKRAYNRTDLVGPALWDVLSPAVVGNVPMTYPPGDVDGTMVSGMMTPSVDETFTHPPEFRETLLDRIEDYRIELNWTEYADADERLREDLDSLVRTRRELMRLLMEREDWRLFFFVYTEPDRLQHRVWDDEALLEHYRYLDDVLGEVMAYCEERDSTLFVVSDHGFGPVSKTVFVNRVLADAGLLTKRSQSSSQSLLSSFGITRERVLDTASSTGLDVHALAKRLPRGVVDSVAKQMPGSHGLYDVDYGETKAFLHGLGSVYVNDTRRFDDGIVPPAEVEAVKESVKTLLADLTAPGSDDPVLDVYDGAEVFPDDPDSPDLTVQPRGEYTVSTRLADGVFGDSTKVVANHRPEGLFMAWGPHVEAGSTPRDASVVDVAPTLLHSVGEAIPERTDGRVLSELFAPETPPAERSPRVRDETDRQAVAAGDDADDAHETDSDEFDDVEERLRGLGYVD
ncbi:alkaline phosphatase family protein [Halomarina salina]|uniref:Alkaline phosphatase family protein n=1 Tax=Halomarina salina TaxID=1872699 RepID=A0ABD5RIF8_9EURY|nr:alkaline phosphatase family protein [Halomarina salina]